jgi:site-specific DNA-methyltransferase (adenine-specific)
MPVTPDNIPPHNADRVIQDCTLLFGDCLERMKEIPNKSIDAIICDLPYGTTACKWDTVIPFEPLWIQYKRLIKDRGAIVLFGSEPFSSYLRMSNIKEYKYDWIWNKVTASGMQIAKYRPMNQHEIISIFSNGTVRYFPIMVKMDKPDSYKCYTKSDSSPLAKNDGVKRTREYKYPKSILTYSNANHSGNFHPTQKPIVLIEYLLKTYTLENETVLDNCMGSGTTGVACIKSGRKFIGIEKELKYFGISIDRVNKAYAERASELFGVNDGR